MILSRRERLIGFGGIAVVLILVLDQLVLSPAVQRQRKAQEATLASLKQLREDSELFADARRMGPEWNGMVTTGLGTDASAAESQVLHSVRTWAEETGLSLSSIKPERVQQEKQFHKITFRATGTGSLSSISRFLLRIETAKIPVRILDVSLNTRKEGTDELTLQMGLSTLYYSPELEKQPRGTLASLGREDRP